MFVWHKELRILCVTCMCDACVMCVGDASWAGVCDACVMCRLDAMRDTHMKCVCVVCACNICVRDACEVLVRCREGFIYVRRVRIWCFRSGAVHWRLLAR
jgi:hypothetical protein